MSGLVIAMQVGMWFGYVTFGFISDALGRKRTYVIYLLSTKIETIIWFNFQIMIIPIRTSPVKHLKVSIIMSIHSPFRLIIICFPIKI